MHFYDFSVFNRRRCEAPNGFNHSINSWSLSAFGLMTHNPGIATIDIRPTHDTPHNSGRTLPDEPMFVLLARDPEFCRMILEWVTRRMGELEITNRRGR
jgi:hypothetical protein